jgi:hypothetical protein
MPNGENNKVILTVEQILLQGRLAAVMHNTPSD